VLVERWSTTFDMVAARLGSGFGYVVHCLIVIVVVIELISCSPPIVSLVPDLW
jgi:hypothetical protein